MCIFFQKCQKMLEKADFGGKCSKIEKFQKNPCKRVFIKIRWIQNMWDMKYYALE